MQLLDPLVETYAESMSSGFDDATEAAYEATLTSHSHAHLMSSRLQGKFLEIISILLQPHRIIEVGTFTGFSAMCLAKGLRPGGMLHTIEFREADAARARSNFEAGKLEDRIILHRGNALSILPELTETWDLAFIDADKTAYVDYYKLILPYLRPGGVILADNVLFHGEVLKEPVNGKNALAIKTFNEFVNADERVEKVLIPIRDGLMLIRKK